MKAPAEQTRKSGTPGPTNITARQGKSTSMNARQGKLTRTTPADRGLVDLPALTPHLRSHVIGAQQTLLVSESFDTLLHGALLCDLLPLLDGRRPLAGIVADLEVRHAAADVHAAVVSLSDRGYVISADHGMDRSRAAYWTSLGASPRWVEQRLAESRVAVDGDDGRLSRQLETSGVGVVAGAVAGAVIDPVADVMADEDVQLKVIVCDDYLDGRYAAVNRRRLEAGAPWMLVRPGGMEALFGPVFHADRRGPCWDCLVHRLRGHKEAHQFLRHVAGEDGAFKPFAAEPVAIEAVYGLVSAEIVKWLVLDEAAPIHGQAISMHVGEVAISKHTVLRRPQCLACGDEALFRPDRPPVPLRLKSSPKRHRNSGGARTVTPEATLAQYRHLVSPVSGIVSWLARTTDENDDWLHVYWAGSNPGIRSRTLSSLRRSLRSKSAGKGSTREQSETSALCEAIERHSGAFSGDEIRTRGRFIDFAAEDGAIHPNDVQLFSEDQLDDAESINAAGHPYNIVPPRFDPSAEIDWTPVWSFTQGRHRYLPTSMLYSMAPEQRGPAELIADSNGCAAGNTLEEAILQGFYELVERDAFAIWWYNRLSVPGVDLSSFDDAFLASATDYYGRCEREVWMLDVTSDTGIPSFVALSRRPDAETEDIIYGAGAHADPRLAALRALCELNQCLTWLPRSGGSNRPNRPMIDDPMALHWWNTARIADCAWLVPSKDAPLRQAAQYPAIETKDTREDVDCCRALVEARGVEFLVLDQTRPDIGMPVVRVIVPGMRHFWARFAPGRLYDVPVEMGFRNQPLTEAELNPAPVIA
ncbi:MAG: TOMM precursor leader peptide-binding protein [Gemmatimonadetes bacterium]|nr:TOMM precursor leader peptide-binding protein [Gemmatimonadota bacterium]MYA77888.1 TOMM precursor leader peptide-binding protein [Gemmatimonadota bacterium]MYG15229.1 TOMM precursor leader peptide-binding protein [Gemmatimonadota bacterium]MYH19288.1 TOMM precursor leader peptide-binding protein [Gemmatimonadota bacterium]